MNRLLLLFFILLYSNKLLANSSVARIFEAAGQYVAASQVIYHFKNSECGYMVQGSQSNLGVIEEIEIKLTANGRIELVKYFTNSIRPLAVSLISISSITPRLLCEP